MATFLYVPAARPQESLVGLAAILADAGVNIEAFSVDNAGVHILPSEAGTAARNLIDNGYDPKEYTVSEVMLSHRPGAFADVAKRLEGAGVKVRNVFGIGVGDEARVFLRTSDEERTEAVLLDLGLRG